MLACRDALDHELPLSPQGRPRCRGGPDSRTLAPGSRSPVSASTTTRTIRPASGAGCAEADVAGTRQSRSGRVIGPPARPPADRRGPAEWVRSTAPRRRRTCPPAPHSPREAGLPAPHTTPDHAVERPARAEADVGRCRRARPHDDGNGYLLVPDVADPDRVRPHRDAPNVVPPPEVRRRADRRVGQPEVGADQRLSRLRVCQRPTTRPASGAGWALAHTDRRTRRSERRMAAPGGGRNEAPRPPARKTRRSPPSEPS